MHKYSIHSLRMGNRDVWQLLPKMLLVFCTGGKQRKGNLKQHQDDAFHLCYRNANYLKSRNCCINNTCFRRIREIAITMSIYLTKNEHNFTTKNAYSLVVMHSINLGPVYCWNTHKLVLWNYILQIISMLKLCIHKNKSFCNLVYIREHTLVIIMMWCYHHDVVLSSWCGDHHDVIVMMGDHYHVVYITSSVSNINWLFDVLGVHKFSQICWRLRYVPYLEQRRCVEMLCFWSLGTSE